MAIPKKRLDSIERQLIKLRRKELSLFPPFRRFYGAHYHRHPDAPFHDELAELLAEMTARRGRRLALAAPRGSAKSTIITLEWVLHSICFNVEPYIAIISRTVERAAELLGHVKNELESNERLRKDFPEVCEIDKKPEPRRWSRYEIITKNNVKISAFGVNQNIRGARHNQHRPSLIILDDIESNEDVQDDDGRFKTKDWFEKVVLKLGDKDTNVVLAGTIHHYDSLLAHYLDPEKAPGWIRRLYRSVIRWADDLMLWQEWSAIYRGRETWAGAAGPAAAEAFFRANRERMLAGTQVLWPQSASYEDLMVKREQEGQYSFDSEYQNDPVNARDCTFNPADFIYWDDQFQDAEALLNSLPHRMVYAAVDPSLGRSSSRGDYSAIVIGAWDAAGKVLYILDADLERRQPGDLIEAVIGFVRSRKISAVAVEANQFQTLIARELKARAEARAVGVTVKEVQNRTDKMLRIQSLEPFIKTGKVRFSRRHRELLDQLRHFPRGRHDDGPDALEMLYQLASNHVDWDRFNAGLARLAQGLEEQDFRRLWGGGYF